MSNTPVNAELVGGPFDGLRVELHVPAARVLEFPESRDIPFPPPGKDVDLTPNFAKHVYVRGKDEMRNRFTGKAYKLCIRFYYKADER